MVNSPEDYHKGKKHLAIVKSVSAKSINPLYFELSNTIFAHAGLFEDIINPETSQVTEQIDKISNIEENYQPGDVVEVWIRNVHKRVNKDKTKDSKAEQCSVEVALYDLSSSTTKGNKSEVAFGKKETTHKIGSLVLCRIIKILERGVKVQFGRTDYGYVDITELYDEFHAYPLKKIEEKLNTIMLGRIIAFSSNEGKSKGSEIYISLRESILNQANWQVIAPEGTTIQFKKKFGYQEGQGDLRTRVLKLGPSSIKENMIFVGYVNETNDKGCFIRLSFNVSARAPHKELSDQELKNPGATFFKNRLVIGKKEKVMLY